MIKAHTYQNMEVFNVIPGATISVARCANKECNQAHGFFFEFRWLFWGFIILLEI